MNTMTFLDNRVLVKTGDITRERVDAIVNAANSSLMGGGGVDGAIHRAGGKDILEECMNIRNTQFPDGLPSGKAVITCGGNLKAKHVIHTVGPVWRSGQNNEELMLKDCYINSLRLAVKHNIRTISFPAISTGIYGYPKKLAAELVAHTIKDFLEDNKSLAQIILIFFAKQDFDTFIKNADF